MKNSEELRQQLRSINRKSYPAYKGLKSLYQFGNYILSIDHVQGDPFASPSSLHVEMPHRQAGIPERYYESNCGEIALRDYIVREAGRQFEKYNFKAKGSGKSGLMSISSAVPVRLMLWELFSDFMWDFRHLEGRFRQKSLKRYCLSFCLNVLKMLCAGDGWTIRKWSRQSGWQKIRMY